MSTLTEVALALPHKPLVLPSAALDLSIDTRDRKAFGKH
jgi:hypothetical protein